MNAATGWARARKRALEWVAITLLAAVPLLPTLRAQFIYDDTSLIRDNALLRGWSAIARVWTLPYWPTEGSASLGLYRPLQLALLAVVWNLGHGSAWVFHAYAVALAITTSITVWYFLRTALAPLPALAAAAWFATHPLHVEAIASVANTSELVVVLCIVSLWHLLRRADTRETWLRAASVGLIATAAIATKESGLLAMPVALVTAWGWKRNDERRSSLRDVARDNRRGILVASAGIAAVLLARVIILGAPVSNASIAAQNLPVSLVPRVLLMTSLWPRIMQMLVWPGLLSPYYGTTIAPTNAIAFALIGVAALCMLLVAGIRLAQHGDRRVITAAAWMLLTYFPASNLLTPTGQVVSDRVLFGMTVGVAMLLGWGMDVSPRLLRIALFTVTAFAIARGAIMSTQYAKVWQSHRSLWNRLVEAMPNEHLGYKLQGMDARARGDANGAARLLARALSMTPSDRQTRFEYGQALYSTGSFAQSAAVIAPLMRDNDAREERGLVALYLDAVGRAHGASAVIAAAEPLKTGHSGPVAFEFTGAAYEQLGDSARADSAYQAGLARTPRDSALLARLRSLRRK